MVTLHSIPLRAQIASVALLFLGWLSSCQDAPAPIQKCEDCDGDGFIASEDCDDQDPAIHPEAKDTACDDIDQDCDGLDTSFDLDLDGFGCDDCDDQDPDRNPGMVDIPCDNLDQDCSGSDRRPDLDADGQACADDCDDYDAGIYLGALEIACDEIDQDCDGQDLVPDPDKDGHSCGEDCDETNSSIHAGAKDPTCDDIDQDCDSCDGPCKDELSSDELGFGDLVINEIRTYHEGSAPDDMWFEIQVVADRPANLSGLLISNADDTETYEVEGAFFVCPGDFLVFGASASDFVDHVEPGLDLREDLDSIRLLGPSGTLIDNVAWDKLSPFPEPPDNASLELDPVHTNSMENDRAEYWCVASKRAGWAGYGSPGAKSETCCADMDDDGSTDCDDCDDDDPTIHPRATEVMCDGIDQNCDGCEGTCSSTPTISILRAGDLDISEVLADPTGAEPDLEWFEVYVSPIIDTINLQCLRVGDAAGAEGFTVLSPLLARGGDFVVFASTRESGVGDYLYGDDLDLDNTADSLSLYALYIEIDAVDYDCLSDPICESGASLNLDPGGLEPTWTGPELWCASSIPWDGGDYGSPGAMNEPCVGGS